jgi:hypothetical protein
MANKQYYSRTRVIEQVLSALPLQVIVPLLLDYVLFGYLLSQCSYTYTLAKIASACIYS